MNSILMLTIPALLISVPPVQAAASPWVTLEAGLEYAKFKAEVFSITGDSVIHILRVNPQRWDLVMLMSSEVSGGKNYSMKEWCGRYKLTAGINAGMYDVDLKRHIGYLKNYQHTNNAQAHPQYHSAAAFNPKQSDRPRFKIIDTDKNPLSKITEDYHTVVENLRLIKRDRQNRWSQQGKKWSEAALGEDKSGNALFIFCRSPYSMYEFNNILLSLPIDLVCAQHLEGGPEAQLYVISGDFELDLMGSFETGFLESGGNVFRYAVPNVIGIRKKN